MSERICIICYSNTALPNRIYCEECRKTRYPEFSRSLPAEMKVENSPMYSTEVNEAIEQLCEDNGITGTLSSMVFQFILPILAGAKGEADLQAFLVKEGHLKPTQAKELVREILAFFF